MRTQATDLQKVQIGLEAQWIMRQPNGRQLMMDKGGKCRHGAGICEDCWAEAKAEVARLYNESCAPQQAS